MGRILLHTLVIWSLAALFAWPAIWMAAFLTDLGLFGTCREGNCAYGMWFIGFPAIWVSLTTIATALWFRWWRSHNARRPRS